MPYIIEARPHPAVAPDPEDPGYDMSVSRTAVATLDEARIHVFEINREAWGDAWIADEREPYYDDLIDSVHALPDSGGTIGPLPNGTVIEVRHAPLNPFADASGWCDIYNRRHATR